MANIIAALIALLHVYIFFLESILWGKPKTNKAFGISANDAKVTAPMAFNQGFYNLFLAIAIVIGLVLLQTGRIEAGRALVDYAVASVFGAGAVLFFSAKIKRAAMVQALPALIYALLRLL